MDQKLTPNYEILVKHTEFFEFWQKQQYIPYDKQATVGEIWSAYNKINPGASPFGCPACVVDMLRYANIHRVTYIEWKNKNR